jgi:hypothetical protein
MVRCVPSSTASVGSISADGLAQLTSNEYLVLAGTLHGIHAITSRLSPTGTSSGAHVIEAETFKMTILLTATGMCPPFTVYALRIVPKDLIDV